MQEKPIVARVLEVIGQVVRWSLPALLLLASGCAGPAAGPTACDGLADKTLAIARSDYARCAGEILGALDEVESSLRRLVDGDAAARDSARSASRRLARLINEAGFRQDAGREVQGGAGRAIEHWPDASMREFNALVINAAAQFNAALVYPNQDNLQQGIRGHSQAASTYTRFR